jgi:hypothetical protein
MNLLRGWNLGPWSPSTLRMLVKIPLHQASIAVEGMRIRRARYSYATVNQF